jgi:hypothetical protein
MKNLIKLFCIIVLTLSLNSCATYQVSTVGHEGVEEITNMNQLRWKMKTDWRFQQDYINFAMNQPYSWYREYYSNNFMWQNGFNSQWSFYANRYQMWTNWSMNSNSWWGPNWHRPYGGNNWGSPFGNNTGWNGYLAGYGYNGWHQVYPYMYGRRGLRGRSNSALYSYTNRLNGSRSLLDSKVSTSEGRTYNSNTASLIENTIIRNNNKPRIVRNKPVINSKPVVVIKPIKNKPWYNNTNNNKPIWNSNSSSRPNSNSRPIRSSVPKNNSNTNRKGKIPR